MSKPFDKLIDKMPADRRKKIKIKTERLKHEMALQDLRQALELTQEELANSLKMKQAAISKFERQSDIYISTLRKILNAMGADLKLYAEFKNGGVVKINQFDEVHRSKRG